MKKLLLPLAIILSSQLFSQPYLPSSLGEIVKHTYYTLSYNEDHEQASWVYYELTSRMVNGIEERTDNFREDPNVSTGSAQLSDYKGSGYDRGHLAPAADMKYSLLSMSESFYLSNMSPQDPGFNRGIWKKLEEAVRQWAIDESNIYVVTGPIFQDNKGSIGTNQVTIPGYYYKVIYDPTGTQKMIALVLANESSSDPLRSFVVSVDYLENLTGIDFFAQLEDDLENTLEASSDFTAWGSIGSTVIRTTSTTKTSTSVQCKGIAKSTGVRCKNKTTNANGYCYLHQSQAPGYKAPAATGSSPDGRCMAITQAGTRCKRKAEPGSKYCWQHKK